MGVADVYRALWRHKLFILFLTAGLVAAAWLLTDRQERIYEAKTLVRVEQTITDQSQAGRSLDVVTRLAETYARISETSAVARKVYEELNESIPLGDVEGSISASPVQDLELLSIRARSPSPQNAQAIANAVQPALEDFARTGTLGDRVTVIDPAEVPDSPASPNVPLTLVVAFMLGLFFNGALALLIDVLGDRFVDSEELELVTGKPVLATIPPLEFTRAPAIQRPARSERASPAGERGSGKSTLPGAVDV